MHQIRNPKLIAAVFGAACTTLLTLSTSARADSAAQLISNVAPEYPEMAANRGIEGWVEVEFLVSPEGNVKNISIVKSEPERTFDAATVRAVRKWKFAPATRGDQPVESQERRRLVFKL